MTIKDFIDNYTNHPVFFIGSGFSFRYVKNTYTWDALLSKICNELYGNDEKYLDIKSKCTDSTGFCSFPKIATIIEKAFNEKLENDRDGKFKRINDIFYESMRNGINLSRFKIYIAELFNKIEIKEDKEKEITMLKKARKNIGSIITTNYDNLIEKIFDFKPLVGNDILLSNPYGAVYKIHGCVNDVSKIIITEDDYNRFDKQYELIRAQMLSLFIHNPIIFIGYSIGDENIKKVLKTIYSYVDPNTEIAEKVRKNFLLIEYEKDSMNQQITEHDIVIEGSNIRINKLKTDDFLSVYESLANITLPVSAMDVRKVQSIVKEIYAGGSIKVMITEDLDDMKNGDRILAIGSSKTIKYQYMTLSEMMQNYFTIIEESNSPLVELINKQVISDNQYFPVFGFSTFCTKIERIGILKENQINIIENYSKKISRSNKNNKKYNNIDEIMEDCSIATSYKNDAIFYAFYEGQITEDDLKCYLQRFVNKNTTDYKRLLCLYDMKKYK